MAVALVAGAILVLAPGCSSGSGGHDGSGAAGTGGGGGQDGGSDTGSTRNPTCVTKMAGCCYLDEDCSDGGECVGATCGTFGVGVPAVAIPGVCKQRFAAGSTQCWQDTDCPHRCTGAQVCNCGQACLVADTPGTCAQ